MNKSEGFKGKTIAITRPIERAQPAVEIVKDNGGIPLVVPTLELEAFPSKSLIYLCSEAQNLDWIIFTSPASLKSLFKYCNDFKENLNPECQVAVIGPRTERVLNKYGLNTDIMPDDYTAEGLLKEFQKIDIKDKKIGVPRTFKARDVLPEGLKNMGATVILAEAYKSIQPKDKSKVETLIDDVIKGNIDAITFTSPLTVTNLFEMAGNKKNRLIENLKDEKIMVAVIGPITQKPLNNMGIESIAPNKYTVKDMLMKLMDEMKGMT
ncbi:uroporphyrinogen-III synthase [Methanobacterium petrolearium]|uniref:uroporphyrinogen-III synthase n=1 Tax=Methanobacterium petrolearium TaxID=710190 RepID=UPI001AE63028|nr:uroporphyrinogen-III synthase [Methanobacterium petrolearium]MBP1946707.1 uroporphyrinogen-III synthase [Methanobacterium petrolearium]BDZ70954.1 uroporphyrinogen III methyltransferase [Methanobacterium petrolearium]